MFARTPAEVHALFVEYFTTKRIDDLVALYEADAVLVPQPGCPVQGHQAIRNALAGFLALQPEFSMTAPKVILSGDVAILFANWTLTGTAPDGSSVNLAGQTSDVVRKQSNGSWRYVIDSPFGAAGVLR